MIDFSTPLSGMERASSEVNKVATKVAALGTPGDTVDLSTETVNLLQAKNDFAANAKVVSAEDRMTKSVLDIVA